MAQKKFIFTLADKDGGIDVSFDSFEDQEPMSAVDASMIMLGLTRVMLDSGLPIEDLDEFLGNIGQAAKEIHEQGGVDLSVLEESNEDPEIEEIEEIEEKANKAEG
jgi:hypothetical protein